MIVIYLEGMQTLTLDLKAQENLEDIRKVNIQMY